MIIGVNAACKEGWNISMLIFTGIKFKTVEMVVSIAWGSWNMLCLLKSLLNFYKKTFK